MKDAGGKDSSDTARGEAPIEGFQTLTPQVSELIHNQETISELRSPGGRFLGRQFSLVFAQLAETASYSIDDRRRIVEQLIVACAEALIEGVSSADVIINIVSRHRDPAPPITIMTPDALILRHAPIADCARYDSLRRI